MGKYNRLKYLQDIIHTCGFELLTIWMKQHFGVYWRNFVTVYYYMIKVYLNRKAESLFFKEADYKSIYSMILFQ